MTNKLSELTDEQKNRWIAEKLGWRKGWHNYWHHPECKNEDAKDGSCCGYIESMPDFIHDPAMRDLLLVKCCELGCRFQLEKEVYVWGPLARGSDEVWLFNFSGPLSKFGLLVVDAFMLASGYKDNV